jgi:hypothetical protein
MFKRQVRRATMVTVVNVRNVLEVLGDHHR